ncbi:MAG: c-type cytochrome [Bryobacteraceae bacterium]
MRRFLCLAAMLAAAIPLLCAADAARGKELFRQCVACHSHEDDERKWGPSLRTLFGKVRLNNGKRVTEENVKTLIIEGYDRMPSYRYLMSEDDLDDLVAFLKTLNAKPRVASAGETLFRSFCGQCHKPDDRAEKQAGSLKGLFRRDPPPDLKRMRTLIGDGHGGAPGTKDWLDEDATQALLDYLKIY